MEKCGKMCENVEKCAGDPFSIYYYCALCKACHTTSEPRCQIRTEMSEGNRLHAFHPDCAHCLRSDRNLRVLSESNRCRII